MGLDSMRSTLILIEEHGKSRKDLEDLTQITQKFLIHCDDLIPHLKDELN